jgi:hypothetical protein
MRSSILVGIAATTMALAASGQGTFTFNSLVPPNIDTRVIYYNEHDLTSGLASSPDFTWQLFGAPEGSPYRVGQLLASGGFGTGDAAGYVVPPAAPIVVPGVPAGSKADVWFAVLHPMSETDPWGPYTVTLTAASDNPNYLPLGKSQLVVYLVPEPDTLALATPGFVGLVFACRSSWWIALTTPCTRTPR